MWIRLKERDTLSRCLPVTFRSILGCIRLHTALNQCVWKMHFFLIYILIPKLVCSQCHPHICYSSSHSSPISIRSPVLPVMPVESFCPLTMCSSTSRRSHHLFHERSLLREKTICLWSLTYFVINLISLILQEALSDFISLLPLFPSPFL